MSARRLIAVTAGTGVATYSLIAPFTCTGIGVQPQFPVQQRCSGFLAFEYFGPRNLLAPQAIITSIVVGILGALFFWLIVARPKAPAALRLIITVVLVVLTLLSAASLGGVIVYTAPVLIPSYWWMASQSGRIARTVWSLLAGLVAFYAWFLISFMMSWNATVAVGALVVAVGSSAIVFLAPKNKDPDLWARP